jgi:putative transposase
MKLKAYKYRIYPTKEQEISLNRTFGCCRFVWNKHVENFNDLNIKDKKLTYKMLKDNPEYSFLGEVSATALARKDNSFIEFKKQYFNKNRKKKLGKPKFKNKRSKQSYSLGERRFTLNQETKQVRIEKIGWVAVVIDRIIPKNAEYRNITVSKTPTGKFYVSILVKQELNPMPSTGKAVGIDLGLKDLFILSNGQVVNNPRWFRDNQAKLKKSQQHLSRKKKGSKRRNKQRIKAAKIHERITNCRNYFLHNLSTAIVKTFDFIAIEDLNVAGMVKNKKLSKSILDASWATFVSMLQYKCDWYGKLLVKIDRFYPSSKTCSNCGHKLDSLTLDVREWSCPCCGSNHNRDLNAAINILKKGWLDFSNQELTSAEYVDYGRGAEVRLNGESHHLASAMKRLGNKFS